MSQDQATTKLNVGERRPHVIRLHGPWQYEPVAWTRLNPSGESVDVPGELPPPGTIKIPADWTATLDAGFRGRVLYQRRFGRPSNIDRQRIQLVLQKVNGTAIVSLNSIRLGEVAINEENRRFELTDQLLSRNELHIEVNLPQGLDDEIVGGIVEGVFLEIHELTP